MYLNIVYVYNAKCVYTYTFYIKDFKCYIKYNTFIYLCLNLKLYVTVINKSIYFFLFALKNKCHHNFILWNPCSRTINKKWLKKFKCVILKFDVNNTANVFDVNKCIYLLVSCSYHSEHKIVQLLKQAGVFISFWKKGLLLDS